MTSSQDKIAILLEPGGDAVEARELARALACGLADESVCAPSGDKLVVRFSPSGISLEKDGMSLLPDFAESLPRLRADRLGRELLVRAAKVKGTVQPRAIDATAGLGQDALLLAAAGFQVLLFERDPIIAALLKDALRRAASNPQLAGITKGMTFAGADSIASLPQLSERPDVVYLDPMFPERQKSAAVKKKFQLLHHIERPCADAESLMQAALDARPRKVVVKRPLKGPCLANVKPSYSLKGKAIRYDVISLA